MARKKEVKVRELDFSNADGYAVTEVDVIYDAIKEDGLGNRDLLYSGLEGENLDILLQHGTLYPDSDHIFAAGVPDEDEFGPSDTTPLSCAWERNKPMLAVYDKTKFEDVHPNSYKFLDSSNKLETLLAVYLLK
jgi:hypothetical protein